MSGSQKHIIQRQVFDLHISDRSEHHALTERLKAEFWQQALPRLSRLFDEIAGDRHIRIDRLEVELPAINGTGWWEKFAILLSENIEREIRNQLPFASIHHASEAAPTTTKENGKRILEAFVTFCRTGQLPWWLGEKDFQKFEQQILEVPARDLLQAFRNLQNEPVTRQRLTWQFSESFWEQSIDRLSGISPLKEWKGKWLQLLSEGKFHHLSSSDVKQLWQRTLLDVMVESEVEGVVENITRIAPLSNEVPTDEKKNLSADLWVLQLEKFCQTGALSPHQSIHRVEQLEEKLLSMSTAEMMDLLRKNLSSEEAAQRLLQQFSNDFFERFLMRIRSDQTDRKLFAQWQELVEKQGKTIPQEERLEFAKTFSLQLIRQEGNSPVQSLANWVQYSMTELCTSTGESQLDVALQLLKALGKMDWKEEDKQLIRQQLERQIAIASKSSAEQKALETERTSFSASPKDELSSTSKPYRQIKTPKAEKIYYVENAGLVLLWPYLQRFLEHIGWVKKKEFIDEEKRLQSILLLQHLVDGGQQWQEPLLPLNKLLCGHSLWKSLPTTLDLTDELTSESTDLLKAVIRNWPILKRTTVDGLRQSFLQREGKLELLDNGWKLSVSRQSYDMLIDQIPWTIRMVKLPWMKKMLRVEW
ncbi:MAG: contractile injection system tape measure protein [Bacteroidota bacterium]